jgi:predicted lipoprotein with Yx(FWY)xxD motif
MKRILITVVATVLAVPAFAQSARLVDWQGMTFYNFSGDTAQASNCNGQCAIDWPPNYASDSAKQWVYKGKPLYRNKNDKNPGDTSGSGVANWSIATQ